VAALPVAPWNEDRWTSLARNLDGLTHALLLAGPEGLGKEDVALALARLALCHKPRGESGACGQCRACELNRAGTHPDLHMITSEDRWSTLAADDPIAVAASRYATPEKKDRKPRRVIAVDQVRAAIASASTKAHMGQRKVFVFSPAESMNTNSANALLKLLEEPPGETLLLLVSHDPGRLPATIRSRCVRVAFRAVADERAVHWLQERRAIDLEKARGALILAGYRPGIAEGWLASSFLDRREQLFVDLSALGGGRVDALALATRWQDVDPGLLLEWLQEVLVDLTRIRCAVTDTEPGRMLRNADRWQDLQALAERVDLRGVFELLDMIGARRAWLGTQSDESLSIEETLIELQALLHRP